MKIRVYNQADPDQSDTVTFNFNHVSTASIAENAISFSVYPNPVSEMLYIRNTGGDVNYVLTSIAGEKIKEGLALASENTAVGVTGITSGIYFLAVTNQLGDRVTHKIVVK